MFAALTYHWANTLFGCLAALMIPIPFVRTPISITARRTLTITRAPQVLFYYGPALRARSKFAVADKPLR